MSMDTMSIAVLLFSFFIKKKNCNTIIHAIPSNLWIRYRQLVRAPHAQQLLNGPVKYTNKKYNVMDFIYLLYACMKWR